jgi:hypothetical protein
LDDEDEIAAITNLDVVVEQVEVETDENIPPTDSSSTENPPTETPDAPQEPEENNEN